MWGIPYFNISDPVELTWVVVGNLTETTLQFLQSFSGNPTSNVMDKETTKPLLKIQEFWCTTRQTLTIAWNIAVLLVKIELPPPSQAKTDWG